MKLNKEIFITIITLFFFILVNWISLPNPSQYTNSFDVWLHFFRSMKFLAGDQLFNLNIIPYPLYLHLMFALIFSFLSKVNLETMYLFFSLITICLTIIAFLIYFFIGKKLGNFTLGLLCGVLVSLMISSESWHGIIWPFPSTIGFLMLSLMIFYLESF